MKNATKLRITYLTLIGAALMFLTACSEDEEPETVVDASGNVYQTMIINTRVWMIGNLRTTEYSDGSGILILLHDDVEWASAGPACTIYEFDIAGLDTDGDMVNAYGMLYNWYAVTASTDCARQGGVFPPKTTGMILSLPSGEKPLQEES